MTVSLDKISEELLIKISEAKKSFHQLVLVVGPSGSGKTALLQKLARVQGCPYLNINLQLSQRLLDLPRNRRPRQVDRVFSQLLAEHPGDLLAADNLEVLFDPSLQVDPLRLLKATSRQRTVVAAWNGTFQQDVLRYAEPDHPEDRSYRDPGVLLLSLLPHEHSTH